MRILWIKLAVRQFQERACVIAICVLAMMSETGIVLLVCPCACLSFSVQ